MKEKELNFDYKGSSSVREKRKGGELENDDPSVLFFNFLSI